MTGSNLKKKQSEHYMCVMNYPTKDSKIPILEIIEFHIIKYVNRFKRKVTVTFVTI